MTDEEIRKLASLARLRIESAEIPELRQQLERILGHMRGLAAVDVSGVEPFLGPRDDVVRLRDDAPTEPMAREAALGGAAHHDGSHVLVPRFVDEG